jgi:hypothetical protein
MASLKERLQDTCICGHQGKEHAAVDRGSYIALERCCAEGCACPQFRRTHNQQNRAGHQSHPGHGRYSKRQYRI